ncbi:all-trans retinoic acid-induced differentiation factor [Erpetoichthys calabaricus]|uniref:EGF-like domain-containing protein n=1 Tax=Erpetoichthys calabaricus TaxID=27687 RepID=A0A8C4RNT0_ERPCA|nr:all-trans retinoic acid-induced differentiation factor [Erpetoichthys calabaricus]
MFLLLSSVAWILSFNGAFSDFDAIPQVCSLCGGTVGNGSAVWDLCYTNKSFVVKGRCCLQKQDEENQIIGLDLKNCSLAEVDDLHEAYTAEVVDLSENPLQNVSKLTFHGFTSMFFLVLPPILECPGGNESWEITEVSNSIRICKGQKSACNSTGEPARLCPENSLCQPDGPGLFQCICVDGFHGYKCLRMDEFPMVEMFVILGTVTALMSSLLWATQRRKAKSS